MHLYHLTPRGVTKADAVVADVGARRVSPDGAIVIGDSPADRDAGTAVGGSFLVANGAWAGEGTDPGDEVYVTEASFGEGFAEVIEALVPG